MPHRPRFGTLFSYDWDQLGHERHAARYRFDRAGFDLFSFPSNARLIGFDLERFARAQAQRGRARGWAGVVSHHEQFGALAAALVAERLELIAPAPEAIVAAQHKLHARRVLERVAPEANVAFRELHAEYGGDIPAGIEFPTYVKPVKAAFSVLAACMHNHAALVAHTRFHWRELWVIRRLVEPFERVARARLPEAGSAHRLMLEEPLPASWPQYNLDGYVQGGRVHLLGVVDALMYPGTQAFMRWQFPSRLAAPEQQRALDVARRFLDAVGFDNGFFNMEFCHDPASGRLAVIEFNPRLASQFSDLYRRVLGVDAHAMALAIAAGADAAAAPRAEPSAAVAASLVYRTFAGEPVPAAPTPVQRAALLSSLPGALIFAFPKSGHGLARDFKWTGSHRYGIVHLGAESADALREAAERASALLGWRAPYRDAPAVVGSSHHAAAGAGHAGGLAHPTRPQPLGAPT